ncbi:SDR family NAD(P)-dependent oxidoreductase, partial [Acinetobacter baumannii]
TGASRGIGRATALLRAEAGAHVVAVARTQGGRASLDDALRQIGGSATLVPLDIKDGDGLDRLGLAIHERWGKLDVLVANGAILGPI